MTPLEKRRILALVRRWLKAHDRGVKSAIRSRNQGRPRRADAYAGIAFGLAATSMLLLLRELGVAKPEDLARRVRHVPRRNR